MIVCYKYAKHNIWYKNAVKTCNLEEEGGLMKKLLVVLLFLFVLVVSASAAISTDNGIVAKPTYDNVVSANVWPYLGAFFNLGYERNLVANISVRARGEYWGLSVAGWNIGGFGVDLFYHPMGKGLEGWYLGPRFDDWIASYSKDGTTGSGSLYWVGLQAGYRWVFDSGFSMALSLGAQKNIAASLTYNKSTSNEAPPLKDLTLPAFDFDLGWAF
jgi:hypothetical protein